MVNFPGFKAITKHPLRWQAAILLTSGIFMGLTPAPVNAWFLAWVALAPLWILVVDDAGRYEDADTLKGQAVREGEGNQKVGQSKIQNPLAKRRRALTKIQKIPLPLKVLVLSFCWGIGYHGLALSWITGIHPMTWMGVPWLASLAIALFAWAFITLWGVGLVVIWAWGLRFLTVHTLVSSNTHNMQTSLLRVLGGTALWCGLEWFWSLGSLYWTSLSYTQSPFNLPILHLGQLSGPLTVTATIVAFNGLLAEAWISYQDKRGATWRGGEIGSGEKAGDLSQIQNPKFDNSKFDNPKSKIQNPKSNNPKSKILSLAGLLLISTHLLGFALYRYPLAQAPNQALKVGIIQGNVPNTIKLYPEGLRRAIEGYTSGYLKLVDQGVEAVLTPETALPFVWQPAHQNRSSLYQAIVQKGIPAWVGAFGTQGQSITNSLFTVDRQGEIVSRFNKVKLVPLGEYIPFESVLGSLINRLSPLDAHLAAGQPFQPFDTPFGRAIVGICYESAFPAHFQKQTAQGGQFILTASNNAHYSATMPAQHHAQDVMRAIENDRWAVRATNTGYSGIVDPHGNTHWLSGINTYELHADTIYRRQTQTLYVRWGNWFTPLLFVATGLFWGVSLLSQSRTKD